MLLDTRHFGTIEIDDEKIISFPEGLPGFEYVKKFVIISKHEADFVFQWLQGVDEPTLAFVIVDPKVFCPEYEIEVPDEEVEILDIRDMNSIFVSAIVVVPEDLKQMTANLKAPVIINMENYKGKQVIQEKSDYKIKHYIFNQLQETGGFK